MNDKKDQEENRLAARAARYVRVGTNVGAVAARVASQRLFGLDSDDSKNAIALAAALGGLKGPIMKVAQLMATIPEALPPEYAQELAQLQSQAPPMGPAFVRRRMVAELGPDWAARFKSFEPQPAASASLGQVHRAMAHDGRGAGRQAAVSRHAVGGGGRPQPAEGRVRPARAHEPGGGDGRDPEGDLGAPARGARLRSGGAPHRALRPDLQGRAEHPRAAGAARAVDQAAADHDLARGPAAHGLQGRAARAPQRHRAGHVPGLVVSRSRTTA